MRQEQRQCKVAGGVKSGKEVHDNRVWNDVALGTWLPGTQAMVEVGGSRERGPGVKRWQSTPLGMMSGWRPNSDVRMACVQCTRHSA